MTSSLPSSAQKDFERAVSLFQQGRLATAEGICGELYARFPGDAELAHFGGVLATRMGKFGLAVERLGRCVRLEPARSRAHAALGFALDQVGRIDEARRAFLAAAAIEPGFADAHNGAGITAFRLGHLEEALASFERALQLAPESVETRLNAARVLLQAGRVEGAARLYREALQRSGGNPDALRLAALGLQQAGDPEACAAAFEQLLALVPGDSMARGQYALALDALGREGEAHAEVERALATPPVPPNLHNTRGVLLMHRSAWREAVDAFREALEADPANVEARINLANALGHMGRRDEALTEMTVAQAEAGIDALAMSRLATLHGNAGRSAIAVEVAEAALRASPLLPDAHMALASELLRAGDVERGWREYLFRPARGLEIMESIAAGSYPPRLPASLAGVDIALLGEQGVGDILFFMRYARPLADAGARLHVRADRRLEPIVSRAMPIASWSDALEIPPAGITLWMGDLPAFVQPIAAEPMPTLRASPDAARAARMRERLGAGALPVVGLAWVAGTQSGRGPVGQNVLSKEFDPAAIGAALKGLRVRFASIQRHPAPGSREALEAALGAPVIDLSDANDDLEDMLALASLLDEYVGVSSTNVHLIAAAGGHGRILVPYPADWRWRTSGDESPWFPGFPTYRQDADGAWSTALAKLAHDLGGNP
jgi:Flp pilus assembly protein TadD